MRRYGKKQGEQSSGHCKKRTTRIEQNSSANCVELTASGPSEIHTCWFCDTEMGSLFCCRYTRAHMSGEQGGRKEGERRWPI